MRVIDMTDPPEKGFILKVFDKFKERLFFAILDKGEDLDSKRYKIKGCVDAEEYKEFSKRDKNKFLKDYDIEKKKRKK